MISVYSDKIRINRSRYLHAVKYVFSFRLKYDKIPAYTVYKAAYAGILSGHKSSIIISSISPAICAFRKRTVVMKIKGNEETKKRLADLAARGSLSHAYIIWGPEGSGKDDMAMWLASAMVCTGNGKHPCGHCRDCLKSSRSIHPDIISVEKQAEKRELLVDQIRQVISDSYVLPNESDKKVYIIYNADNMNTRAQNAFLKLLEEPPSYSAYILTGTNPGIFLDTIRSRCVEILAIPDTDEDSLHDRGSEAYEIAAQIIELFKKGDRLALITEISKAEKFDRFQISDFLDNLYQIAARTLKTEQSIAMRTRFYEALDLLQSFKPMLGVNVGPGHITGMLAAKLNAI